jgi:hypothetical protein
VWGLKEARPSQRKRRQDGHGEGEQLRFDRHTSPPGRKSLFPNSPMSVSALSDRCRVGASKLGLSSVCEGEGGGGGGGAKFMLMKCEKMETMLFKNIESY